MLKPILVVEDDLKDIELTLFALERAGLAHQVTVLRDGSEALDYLYSRNDFHGRGSGNPAVILLDLKLPKIDGHGVLRAIRAEKTLSKIPVAMLSSSREEMDVARAYELGANCYVVKPFGFHEFVNIISELGLFWAVLNVPPLGSPRVAPRKL